jgi:hypothetical protein
VTGMDEVRKTIEEVLKTNEWLNGDIVFAGDLSAL